MQEEAMPPSFPPQKREAAPRKKRAKSRWSAMAMELATIVLSALVISIIVKTFFLQAFAIPSESMENTLVPGDRIIVNKLADTEGDLNRGDVVVFVDPGNWLADVPKPERNFVQRWLVGAGEMVGIIPQNVGNHLVKRIIGMPGDRVVCCNESGKIEINGHAITETYLKPGVQPSLTSFDVVVPPGHVWLMGDNRDRSKDARYHQLTTGFGFVPISNIEGRAWLTMYPLSRFSRLDSVSSVFDGVPDPK